MVLVSNLTLPVRVLRVSSNNPHIHLKLIGISTLAVGVNPRLSLCVVDSQPVLDLSICSPYSFSFTVLC